MHVWMDWMGYSNVRMERNVRLTRESVRLSLPLGRPAGWACVTTDAGVLVCGPDRPRR
jgi:hypothetical protein